MKMISIICAAVILFSVLFPVFYTKSHTQTHLSPGEQDEQPAPPVSAGDVDSGVKVSVLNGGEVTVMSMSDYLTGVVAAEMPASFDKQALMAQAVAARTYTLYKMVVAPSSRHPQANVCTDSSCCKAYVSVDKMRENWGDSFDSNYEKIRAAEADTDGICLVYDDEPILAVFHSSSAGKTENSGDVWSSQLPYLVSVDSPETQDTVPNYTETLKISYDDFKDTVLSSYPAAFFPDDRENWVTDVILNDSGRIKTAVIGNTELSGPAIRKLFSLRSSAIAFDPKDDYMEITTTGYGHGVGMSQYGANTLAKQGYGYEDILKWYYTGVELGSVRDFL